MAFNNTYTFDTKTDVNISDWLFTDPVGTGLQDSNTARRWCWDSDETTSSNVGPIGGQGGNPDGYVYTEMSSPGANGDVFYMETVNDIDSSKQSVSMTWYYSARTGSGDDATIYVEGWNGTSWVIVTTQDIPGSTDATWYQVSSDFDSYTNIDFKIRFRIVMGSGGTAWHKDIGLDTINIVAVDRIVTPNISTISDDSTLEDGTTKNIHTVTLESATQQVETYSYSFNYVSSDANDIGAISFSDGVSESGGVLTVPSGISTFDISVTLTDDVEIEDDETYTITIEGVTGTGTILNDDIVTNDYSNLVSNMNPIHYWRLEGDSTDTGSGVTLNGTDTNMEYGTYNVVQSVSEAASFNLDGNIKFSSSSDLDNMTITQKTISLWIIPTLDTLVFKVFRIGNTTSGLHLSMGAGLIPCLGIVDSSTGDMFYGDAIRINEPSHFLIEYDNGSVKMYQNGNLTVDSSSTKTSISATTDGADIGNGESIRVQGGTTFTTYDLHAKLSNVAIWNSSLTTQQKSDLFTNGAQQITRTMYFNNMPEKTEIRVFDINDSLNELGGLEFIDTVTGSNVIINFNVTTTIDVRIVLANVEAFKNNFNADVTLSREDYTYDGSLLLTKDRTYNNPGGWYQPIPISKISNPYISGKSTEGEVLTVNPGTYTGSGILTYSYQWYRDGNIISGETNTTYTIVAGDIDLPITCKETVDNIISNMTTETLSRTWVNVKLYSIYEHTTGLIEPTTSFSKVNFDTEVVNINNSFSNNNGTYTLPTGDFLVIATMKYDDSSNGRVCPEGRVVYSGSGTNAPIYGSGFSRNSNNRTSWVRATSYIHNASSGDTVSFEHRSDTDTLTGGSVANYCHIQIINMTPTALLMANDSNDTGAYAGQTWNTITWDNQIDSQGTSITKSGNTFTLKANKTYLVSYGISLANYTGSTRTQRVSKAQINSVDIPASFSYAYMRQSSDEFGDIGNMFMYKTGGSDETLELFAQRGEALSDGSVVRRVNTSSVFILDVTGANFYSAYDGTGGQLVTPTTDVPLNLVNNEINTATEFTKNSSSQLTCNTDGYWIMGASAFVTNTAQTGGTRMTRGMKFIIDGVDQKVGESGSYQRNDQSSTDTWDMAMGVLGVYYLTSGNTVQFNSFDAGDDGNGNSSTVANKCGFWALDINSI